MYKELQGERALQQLETSSSGTLVKRLMFTLSPLSGITRKKHTKIVKNWKNLKLKKYASS
jgi:hypothetical protein